MRTKNFKNYIPILAIAKYRNWLNASLPLSVIFCRSQARTRAEKPAGPNYNSDQRMCVSWLKGVNTKFKTEEPRWGRNQR